MAQSGNGERTGGKQVIFLAPGGGRLYEQGGFRGAIKVDSKESGVVEGTLTFRAGEETIKAEADSFLFRPSGVVHTFSNRSLVAWHRSIDYPSLLARLNRWRSG